MIDKQTPYILFLEQLRITRITQKLTQAQLANKLKLSRAQYTAIENGRSQLNFTHLYNLAIALHVRFTIGNNGVMINSEYLTP